MASFTTITGRPHTRTSVDGEETRRAQFQKEVLHFLSALLLCLATLFLCGEVIVNGLGGYNLG